MDFTKNSISCKESGKSRNTLDASVKLGQNHDKQGGQSQEQSTIPQLTPKGSHRPHFPDSHKPYALALHNTRLGINKSQHTRPPFLYEHYPLKPSLLYGSPSSYVRDPLKRLDQIYFLPQSSLHSISATLPTCQCALVNPHLSPHDNTQNLQHTRLESGADACSEKKEDVIVDSTCMTKNVCKMDGKSLENVCSTCRDVKCCKETPIGVENMGTTKDRDSTVSSDYKSLSLQDSSNLVRQTMLKPQDSLLLYQKPLRRSSHHARMSVAVHEEVALDLPQPKEDTAKLSSNKASTSTNSLDPDYNVSVPIFELLLPNETYYYTNQLALKHKDSVLFYADLRQKRRKSCAVKTLEIRRGKLLSFVRFLDEARLVCTPSDEDIVFGNAGRAHHKSLCWEESRIAWLAELERRQEVRRRRKRRSEHHKPKGYASESVWGEGSFLCDRIRLWLAKWYT